MTVLMSLVGLIVFTFSCFTAGFKSAAKRLGVFILAGLAIDVLLTILAVFIGYAALHP